MVISLQRQDYNRAKHCREFGETEQRIWRNKWESHLTSTVMNMENGRCETTFSMLSPDKKIGFKPFSPYFREMIMWGRNNRGNNRSNHKSHKGATKTILLTPITVEKIVLVVPLLFNVVEFFIYNFFIDNEMRLRLRSTSTTRTFTCWCNFTTWVGSAT